MAPNTEDGWRLARLVVLTVVRRYGWGYLCPLALEAARILAVDVAAHADEAGVVEIQALLDAIHTTVARLVLVGSRRYPDLADLHREVEAACDARTQ